MGKGMSRRHAGEVEKVMFERVLPADSRFDEFGQDRSSACINARLLTDLIPGESAQESGVNMAGYRSCGRANEEETENLLFLIRCCVRSLWLPCCSASRSHRATPSTA